MGPGGGQKVGKGQIFYGTRHLLNLTDALFSKRISNYKFLKNSIFPRALKEARSMARPCGVRIVSSTVKPLLTGVRKEREGSSIREGRKLYKQSFRYETSVLTTISNMKLKTCSIKLREAEAWALCQSILVFWVFFFY